ncbi:MAG: adenosylcobinamide-GDP ribazoletransferase [Gammaproteobacteria bacterium]|nr:adenosylcobinamide-GDP ribazoletransferase [Gammaproteobacteria bacterium]
MRSFWVALQFLTRIPVLRLTNISAQERGRSVLYYPVVGLLIGALLSGMHISLVTADASLQAAIILLAWVLITGGLHLDGLADSADAWAGSHGEREKALRIMKDAASGPAGVTAIVLILLLKFATLSVLIRENIWQGLIIAPVLGRMAIVFLFLSTPYVRLGGLGADHAAHLSRLAATIILILVTAIVIALGGIGLAALAMGFSLLLILRLMMIKRLGGVTGDTLGAACELVEAAVLAAIVLVWG